MSLPETCRTRSGLARIASSALLGVLLVAAGCSVQPLYGDATRTGAIQPAGGDSRIVSELASISVGMASGGSPRVGQEVRNHLIFLLRGGSGENPSPRYSLDLTVTASRAGAASIQRTTRDQEPTAAVLTVRASYVLRETSTGRVISRGLRQATAAFDLPRQEFAALRAQRDAEDRAAREAAELVRLSLAQDLVSPRDTPTPALISSPSELDEFSDDLNGGIRGQTSTLGR